MDGNQSRLVTGAVPDTVSSILTNARRPAWWKQQYVQRVGGPLLQRLFGNDGTYVLDEEWDVLLILDGCRYDLFEEIIGEYELPGTLQKRQSRGSGSLEFLEENFEGRALDDIVYVTANPFVKIVLDDEVFHRVEHVWLDGWNEDLDTVPAEAISDRVREARESYPDKRIIGHYMQPHYPFVGSTDFESGDIRNLRAKAVDQHGRSERSVWDRLSNGEVTESEVQDAYADNLRYVLDDVSTLVRSLSGQVVLTSDHGNAFGKRHPILGVKIFGHPTRLRLDCLVDVPWYSVDADELTGGGDSKGAHAGREPDHEGSDPQLSSDEKQVIDDRLSDLGYS